MYACYRSLSTAGGGAATISIRHQCKSWDGLGPLDSHASRLRRKLNTNGDCAYVLNVWGVGYRLVAADF
jgi:hypothetical protein